MKIDQKFSFGRCFIQFWDISH